MDIFLILCNETAFRQSFYGFLKSLKVLVFQKKGIYVIIKQKL